jgi:Rrf2 family protein
MKLTRASTYALHAVAYMANQKKNLPTASHVIAQKRGISDRFLLKVLKPLVNAQVLFSVKGPNGGYRLARPAAEISVLEVLEAVDGPIRGHAPSGGDKDLDHPLNRRLAQICNQLAEQQRKQLGKIKISEISLPK